MPILNKEKETDQLKTVSPLTRELMLKVIDGDERLVPIMFMIKDTTRCNDILRWFILNRLTGKNLFEWFKLESQGSLLKCVAVAIKYLERNEKIRPLYAVRDFQ